MASRHVRPFACLHVRFLQPCNRTGPNMEEWPSRTPRSHSFKFVPKYPLPVWLQVSLILLFQCLRNNSISAFVFCFLPTKSFLRACENMMHTNSWCAPACSRCLIILTCQSLQVATSNNSSF